MTHGAVTKRFIPAAALAGAFTMGMTGCAYVTPQATTIEYSASDGVNGTVGDVQLSNVLAVSEDGEDVTLLGRLTNNGEDTARVTLESVDSPDVSEQVTVGADEFVDLSADEDLVLAGVDTEVGGILNLYVQYGDEPGIELHVPVLDGSLPEYEQYLP